MVVNQNQKLITKTKLKSCVKSSEMNKSTNLWKVLLKEPNRTLWLHLSNKARFKHLLQLENSNSKPIKKTNQILTMNTTQSNSLLQLHPFAKAPQTLTLTLQKELSSSSKTLRTISFKKRLNLKNYKLAGKIKHLRMVSLLLHVFINIINLLLLEELKQTSLINQIQRFTGRAFKVN
jgi:hypothetical protein